MGCGHQTGGPGAKDEGVDVHGYGFGVKWGRWQEFIRAALPSG